MKPTLTGIDTPKAGELSVEEWQELYKLLVGFLRRVRIRQRIKEAHSWRALETPTEVATVGLTYDEAVEVTQKVIINKAFVAYGRGFCGAYADFQEARAVIQTNGQGAVYAIVCSCHDSEACSYCMETPSISGHSRSEERCTK